MNKFYLFSYGTLMDIQIQKILFEQEIKMVDTTLKDYKIYADIDDYYYVKEQIGQEIQGKVLELTQEQIWIADQWEEIPNYIRKKVKIKLEDGNNKEVFIYEKTNIKSEIEIKPDSISNYSIEEVIQLAKDFKKQLNDISIPFSDLYIQIPCYSEKQINDNSYIDNLSFLKNMKSTSNIEFTDSFCGDINRVFLDRVYIVIEEKVQISDVYLTIHNSTKLGVLTFMMPAIAVDSIKVLHNMSLNSIKIRKESSNSEDSIKMWLSDYYIDVYGSARAIMFTPLKPSEKELLLLLACEQVPEQYNLTSEQFNKFAGKNLGQYDSSEIYASENFLIVIQQNFDDNFTDRVVRQSLTLFISEILQLQDAAVSKVDSLIRNEIYETRNYALKKDSLKVLEKLVNESCQSIMLWDIRNFKFGTSRYLADNISNAFGIERILQNQINNKIRLEQLINIHNASINELENKNINKLLLLLAMLQVIPTLYLVSLSFFKHELDGGNYISAFSSMAICFILWLIFSIRTSVEKRKKIFDK